jgi:hypothetical protein
MREAIVGRTSGLRGTEVAQRIKIGLGLFLFVIATQALGSIALAQSRHGGGACKPSQTQILAAQKAGCHVS